MGRTVYSTGVGKICPECGRADAECRCRGKSRAKKNAGGGGAGGAQRSGGPARSGKPHVALEKKGRRGKAVTVIHALPLDGPGLAAAAKALKAKAGTGGTVKDGAIELQGDRVALAKEWLAAQDFA